MLRLLSRTGTQTADGRCLPQETARQVFCSVESVSRAEWAAAGQLGLAPQWRVTLFAPDYNGEDAAELDGVRYGVYRTYHAKDDRLELYLERRVGL